MGSCFPRARRKYPRMITQPMKKASTSACLLAALSVFSHAEEVNYAAFGNSLMGNIKLGALSEIAAGEGHTLNYAGAGGPGFPIEFVWNDRQDEVQEILTEGVWDIMMLQPFSRELDADIASTGDFLTLAKEHNPDIALHYYAQFTNDWGIDYQRMWLTPEFKESRTAEYYESLTHAARADFPDTEVYMIPVGHAFALLDHKIKAGLVPGVNSVFDLWADATHVNNFGEYLTGMVFYACLFNESPVDLPIGGYQGSADDPTTWVITEDQARVVRETAWQIAATHELSPVTGATDPLEIATPAITLNGVAGEAYSYELLPAFGQRPYTWSVVSGTLPTGLTLTSTGVLEGTPGETGDFNMRLKVTDAANATAEKDFTLTIEAESAPEIQFESLDLGTFQAGEYINIPLTATGGNGQLLWDFSDLRNSQTFYKGLRMTGDGVMVGAIGLQGDHELKVTVKDADFTSPESDTVTFTITITDPLPDAIDIGKLPDDFLTPLWQVRKEHGNGWEDVFFAQHEALKQFSFDKVVRGTGSAGPAYFHLFHDEKSLYAVVRVFDGNIHVNSEDYSEGDSIEIYFDIFNDRELIYNADDRRFILAPDGTVAGYTGQKSEVLIHQLDDGYIAQIRMPSHAMNRKIEKGAVIGFDVAVNDKDSETGEVTTIMWHGEALHDKGSNLFGVAIVSEETALAPAGTTVVVE